jgi:hypothetical protein
LFALLTLWVAHALAGDLSFTFTPYLDAGQQPDFTLTSPDPLKHLQVVVEAGGELYRFERHDVPPGEPVRFAWARDESVTSAAVTILAEYPDFHEEEMQLPISYHYAGQLSVDLGKARVDLARRVMVVGVTARVDRADIVAYGAHKSVLDQTTVDVGAGPGEIEVPWVGLASEVVLLDITLHSGGAWAGFTYSPWFLELPHEDVLFESDLDAIRPEEEYKLAATLERLREVLDKYGDLVPVKLYLAGCTDTVGDPSHNLDLSRRRARAIAGWLRDHGYDRPIFYHGFGESWLAAPTADNVDMQANRRAVYMVGANPPPPGSGVPAGSWTAL